MRVRYVIAWALAAAVNATAWGQDLGMEASQAGSGAELELKWFGKRLEPGVPVERGPFHQFNLSVIGAAYAATQQYRELLRLCRFKELDASGATERSTARDCQRASLTNLGRIAEAQQIGFDDGKWMPEQDAPSAKLAQWWAWSGVVHTYEGNPELAKAAFEKAIAIADVAIKHPPDVPDPKVRESLAELHVGTLSEVVADARNRLAVINLHDQRFQDFDRYLSNVWGEAWKDPSTRAHDAVELAMVASLSGRNEPGPDLYRALQPSIRAGAGFRDIAEPISGFRVHPSAVPVLGDETTQPLYSRTWVRLAFVYRGLGRDVEAARLLEEAHSLAKRFILEPAEANTAVAFVEESQALFAADRGDWTGQVELLRSARSKWLEATLLDRTVDFSRRAAPIGSPLLADDARLLGAFVQRSGGVVTDPGEIDLVLGILRDFSASRADINSQMAARTLKQRSTDTQALLEAEGRLIDEVLELKAQLGRTSSASGSGRTQAQAQARISEIYRSLSDVKGRLGERPSVDRAGARSFREQLGQQGATYWQWVFHPYGNFRVAVQDNAVRIEKLTRPVSQLKVDLHKLYEASALREVRAISQIPPFPTELAGSIFQQLFGETPSSDDRWILGVSRFLDSLPWSALRVPVAGREQWLVQARELVITPSWTAWLELAAAGPSKAANDLLAIGDPLVRDSVVRVADLSRRGAFVAAAAGVTSGQWARKRSAFAAELDGLSALYDPGKVRVLKGADATKNRLLAEDLASYKRIVFSTHGYAGGAIAAAVGPALELSQAGSDVSSRLLLASEVAKLRLDADLVVLSACDTSAPDGFVGSEGYSGLASAFLLAGSRAVMATLWPVETEATRELVTGTFHELAGPSESRSAPGALRRSVVQYLNSARGVREHPYFWAALSVIGR